MKDRIAKKYYIGLAVNYHDSAIALVDENGQIVFAEATERYTQNKRALATAADTYFFAKKIAQKFPMSDYEIAVNWKQFENLFSYMFVAATVFMFRNYYGIVKYFSRRLKIDSDEFAAFMNFHQTSYYAARANAGAGLKFILNQESKLAYKKNHNFDHHLSHAYHAYFTSPYNNATIAIIDGGGDKGRSFSVYKASGQEIELVFRNPSLSSLGVYYGSLTYLCGFDTNAGEDWKMMGMAPYGKLNEAFYNDLKNWIFCEGIEIKNSSLQDFLKIREKVKNNNYPSLKREDIAYTGQYYFEELVLQLLNEVYKKWPNDHLVFAGGCALNSSANGKIHTRTSFKKVYVPSAPADDGCSIGAALLNFKKFNPDKNIPHHQFDPYLGSEIEQDDLELFIRYSGYKSQKLPYADLYKLVAKEIFDGKIVAWVQGRAEFGPRALGNRSILANPTLADMKDRINAHVKFREEFRPFAPSVLEEYAVEFFEEYQHTPYMERVLKIREDKRSILKAVNHVDNTGRLQTVTKELNVHFYNLISEFNKISGVPVLLNTSLNVMGKPIVNSVNDISAVFANSGIDLLVVNDVVFYKAI